MPAYRPNMCLVYCIAAKESLLGNQILPAFEKVRLTMENDTQDIGEITPEMVDHFREEASKMRAQYIQGILSDCYYSVTRLLNRVATVVFKALCSVFVSVGRPEGTQSNGPARP